ncbi:MAG: cupin domain-containing protein [Halobacteriaceae archaeon]
MDPVTLTAAFETLEDTWSPKTVGAVDDHRLKVARLEGEFVWHAHPDADELFWVQDGQLRIELREEPALTLGPGEFVVIPAGVEHKPVAEAGCDVVLIERAGTANTGDADAPERTTETDWLDGIQFPARGEGDE